MNIGELLSQSSRVALDFERSKPDKHNNSRGYGNIWFRDLQCVEQAIGLLSYPFEKETS